MPDAKGRWCKGETGNKKGRPPVGTSFAEQCRKKLNRNAIIRQLRFQAEVKGNLDAAKLLLGYAFGAPPSSPTVEINLDQRSSSVDLSRLSFQELETLRRLRMKLDGQDPGPARPSYEPRQIDSGEIIDVEAEENSEDTAGDAMNAHPQPDDATRWPTEATTSTPATPTRPSLQRENVVPINSPRPGLKDSDPSKRYRW